MGLLDVVFGEQDLAVEVGQLDDVGLDAVHLTDSRHDEGESRGTADAAYPDHGDPGLPEQQLGVPTAAAGRAVHPPEQGPAPPVALPLRGRQLASGRSTRVFDVAGADEVVDGLPDLLAGSGGVETDQVRDDLVRRPRSVQGLQQRPDPPVRIHDVGGDATDGAADPDSVVPVADGQVLGFDHGTRHGGLLTFLSGVAEQPARAGLH